MAFKLRLRDPALPVSVEAWRQLARRKLPNLPWAYIEGGADDHVALKANTDGFRRWRLRQKSLTGIAKPDLGAMMAGEKLAMPLALAPTGAAGLSHWTAELATSRAAEACGTRMVHGTAASYTLEEVAEATEENHWFQLYPFSHRGKVGELIDRAQAAGYTALFVTVDVPVLGNREGERTSGMSQPWTLTPSRVLDMLGHPGWLWNAMRHRRLAAVHYLEAAAALPRSSSGPLLRVGLGAADDAARSVEAQSRYMQADLHWDDLAWMRDRWKGRLYVKGVLDADDAVKCIDQYGAQGVVVSNHGGRQLGNAVAPIDALPGVVEQIGDRAEVFMDCGVRRGTDVITALCLGANGVFIGRPYLYGLAAGGEAGVKAVLEIFRAEIERAMILMGCPSVAALDRSWLVAAD